MYYYLKLINTINQLFMTLLKTMLKISELIR